MNASARPYHARAPRYVFRPIDQSFLRYAGMDTRGTAWHANVRDLSETGLSFALGEAPAPSEGDMMKLEFAVPGRKQIACFATVVRVEEIKQWDADWGDRGFTLVALHFRNLPDLHRRAIHLSLQGRVGADEENEWADSRRSHAIKFGASVFGVVCALFAMATPFETWLAPFHHWF